MRRRGEIVRSVKVLWTAILLCVLFAFGVRQTSYAAADTASLDLTQTGGITVKLAYTISGGTETAVKDGELTLYQVATLYLDDGNMAYQWTNDFSGYNTWAAASGGYTTAGNEPGADEIEKYVADFSASLEAYVEEEKVSGTVQTITSSSNGTVTFENLTLGLYLVVQTEQSTGYYTINPFIVTVPYAEESQGETEEDGSSVWNWTYVVNASPKCELEPIPETESESETETETETERETETETETEAEIETEAETETETETETEAETEIETETETETKTGTETETETETKMEIETEAGMETETETEAETEAKTETEPQSESGAASGSGTETESETENLPQTGRLIWPIPLLLAGGLVLIVLGWYLTRSNRKGKDHAA
ncbi:MAG: hypothetical protein LUF35_11920 [Lachnospiraceae bacterium]|nr:hypothetical protein [Lachnospiraceae bacterium]